MTSYIFSKFVMRSLEVLLVAYVDEETNCESHFEIIVRSISYDKILYIDKYETADDARRAYIYKILDYWF